MASITADIVIVGAGPSGLGAARTARRKGASVVLVERDRLGGDCTWVGCVPSKALVSRARDVAAGRRAGLVGEVDTARVMQEVRATIATIAGDEDEPALEAMGVEVLRGSARFTAPRSLDVDGTTVTAGRAVVLATGSVPVTPPIPGLEEAGPLTNETVFDLPEAPASLVVLGGGPIGLELGQAFARLGTDVTILEADRIAAKEEPEASAVLRAVLEREGVTLVEHQKATEVRSEAGTHHVTIEDGRSFTGAAVLASLGRAPVTDGLELDRIGVGLTERGAIDVDEKLQTAVEGVYAVGDCTQLLPFTHAGDAMGSLAVSNALGLLDQKFSTDAIPWVTFTEPEIGRVGMTEAQAYEAHGEAAQVAYLPLDETDRGRVTGRTDGFVKLVTGPRGLLRNTAGGRFVGATIVAETGGELVHEVALLMRSGAFAGRLAQTVHAYPTWALAVRECAAQLFFEYRGRTARPARPAR